MTREETAQILAVIETTYTNYKPKDKTLAINLWNSILGSYDYNAVLLALQTYIANDVNGFAPVPGQINAILNKFKNNNADMLTGMEAWSMVSKALRNSGYHSQEEFDKLPPDVQRAVGSATMLHTWALDEHYNESVVMSQFLKSYNTAREQRQEMDKLPDNVRALVDETIKRLEG